MYEKMTFTRRDLCGAPKLYIIIIINVETVFRFNKKTYYIGSNDYKLYLLKRYDKLNEYQYII